jgi:hypothetical protein
MASTKPIGRIEREIMAELRARETMPHLVAGVALIRRHSSAPSLEPRLTYFYAPVYRRSFCRHLVDRRIEAA